MPTRTTYGRLRAEQKCHLKNSLHEKESLDMSEQKKIRGGALLARAFKQKGV